MHSTNFYYFSFTSSVIELRLLVILKHTSENKKIGNERITVTSWCIRVTTVAIERNNAFPLYCC